MFRRQRKQSDFSSEIEAHIALEAERFGKRAGMRLTRKARHGVSLAMSGKRRDVKNLFRPPTILPNYPPPPPIPTLAARS